MNDKVLKRGKVVQDHVVNCLENNDRVEGSAVLLHGNPQISDARVIDCQRLEGVCGSS